ncbi:MAG: cytochrome b/b6 domain-containing protein [Planctomycetales bacterium]|nr:cytochrome b/b6 domain-containing protein [Planctomycetales bacterium]
MSKALVWDYPTRLFHWTLTAGFAAAFGLALATSHRSPWFPIHMLLGLALAWIVLLRVIWGVIGSRYARFASFGYGPAALAKYLRGAATSNAPRFVGHNPGSAYATYGILTLLLTTAGTGVLWSRGYEAGEELHEISAWALAAVVVAHILGVAWHSWRHRENLAASMVTGRKEVADPDAGIAAARPWAAAAFAMLIAAFATGLYRNYDQQTRDTHLPLIGTKIHLGEGEHH